MLQAFFELCILRGIGVTSLPLVMIVSATDETITWWRRTGSACCVLWDEDVRRRSEHQVAGARLPFSPASARHGRSRSRRGYGGTVSLNDETRVIVDGRPQRRQDSFPGDRFAYVRERPAQAFLARRRARAANAAASKRRATKALKVSTGPRNAVSPQSATCPLPSAASLAAGSWRRVLRGPSARSGSGRSRQSRSRFRWHRAGSRESPGP